MARGLLFLLLALALAACGAQFASAEETLCGDEGFASVSQIELPGNDELLEEELGDEELFDDEDWEEGDDSWDGEELGDEESEDEDVLEEGEDDFDEEDDEACEPEEGVVTTAEPQGRNRRGGRGPDRFVGDARRNKFFGAGGDDFLDGRGGVDDLRGGPDDDTLVTGARGRSAKRVTKRGDYANGGRGNDVIRARNGHRDHIDCGRGKDRVLAERGDAVSRNCESIKLG